MSNYLGFEPSNEPNYYFVSYNNEDAERVGAIAQKLCDSNVPLWYDFGIEYGKKWKKIITEKIANAQAVILFFTKGILLKEESYVQTEYEIATEFFDKKVYVVMLDYIEKKSVPADKVFWLRDIWEKQNIDIFDINDPDIISNKIMSAVCLKNHKDTDHFESKPTEVTKKSDAMIKTFAGRMILNNRYELKEIIGEGGFGVTYKAKDLKQNNIVAIKVGNCSTDSIINLHKYLMSVKCDNLCQIYDAVRSSSDESYIVMEWFEEFKPLSDVKVYHDFYRNLDDNYHASYYLFVLIDVLKGLKCLHENNIIHADINPANIMTNGFTTKLIDYSSSFFVNEGPNIDEEHTIVMGGYYSPETKKDFRSDIYSVGMVAFKWFTGHIPNRHEDGKLILDKIKLDDCMMKILSKATSFDPNDRYQSADEFIVALETYFSYSSSISKFDCTEKSSEEIVVKTLNDEVIKGKDEEAEDNPQEIIKPKTAEGNTYSIPIVLDEFWLEEPQEEAKKTLAENPRNFSEDTIMPKDKIDVSSKTPQSDDIWSDSVFSELEKMSGDMYFYEHAGEQRDYKKAVEHYTSAAKLGNADAQYMLSVCYYNGYGVEIDRKKGFEYCALAAENENADAQYFLGKHFYYKFFGGKKNYKKAHEWFSLAANQGHASAQYYLGCIYRFGHGIKKDTTKAFELFSLSAKQDNAEAQRCIGDFYYYGIEVKKDIKKAFEYYTLAAEKGSTRARENLKKYQF